MAYIDRKHEFKGKKKETRIGLDKVERLSQNVCACSMDLM